MPPTARADWPCVGGLGIARASGCIPGEALLPRVHRGGWQVGRMPGHGHGAPWPSQGRPTTPAGPSAPTLWGRGKGPAPGWCACHKRPRGAPLAIWRGLAPGRRVPPPRRRGAALDWAGPHGGLDRINGAAGSGPAKGGDGGVSPARRGSAWGAEHPTPWFCSEGWERPSERAREGGGGKGKAKGIIIKREGKGCEGNAAEGGWARAKTMRDFDAGRPGEAQHVGRVRLNGGRGAVPSVAHKGTQCAQPARPPVGAVYMYIRGPSVAGRARVGGERPSC